jgi:predicted PurR-regulated permease PerM
LSPGERRAPVDGEPSARRSIRIELGPRTALLVVATVGAVWLAIRLLPVLLVIVVALMGVGTLTPLVVRLERRGFGRGWAIATVFGGFSLAFVLFCVVTVPRLAAQVSEIVSHLPQLQSRAAEALSRSRWGQPLADSLRQTNATEWIRKIEEFGLSYSSRAAAVLAYAVTSIFLTLYLIIDRDRMRGALFAVIPRAHHLQASRILINLEEIVGGYMRGQFITSVLMAVYTFTVLCIARVPNALALATLAGVADVLPYVGGLLACGPAVLASMQEGTGAAVGVLGALAVYQEVESRFIVPRVYGKVLRLPAATVMIALLVGGELMGILGALLALPIAAGLRMVIEELRLDLPGEDTRLSIQQLQSRRDQAEQREFAERAAGAPAAEAAAIAIEIAQARRGEDPAERADAKL